jgi:hypothetical protein
MNTSSSFNNSLQKTNAIIQNNIDAITNERKKLTNDKLTFIKRCQTEQDNLDKLKSDFEQEKKVFNDAKIAFEQEKKVFNDAKIAFEQKTPEEKNNKLRHFSITYKK